jgi:rod shape-determining protein MreC
MKNVINFLIRNVYVLIFILLQGISLTLVLSYNPFQRGAFMASSNAIASNLFYVTNSISEYFALKSKNESLANENTLLKNQIQSLQTQLAENEISPVDSLTIGANMFSFISAKVINKTTNNLQNYLTLNKGALDGIEPQMGIISADGLVGQVSSVSDHFSVVIPIINNKTKVSALLTRSNYAGSLSWDGKDPRYALLEGIPHHVEMAKGDTLVTSGYSSIYPQGIIIGTVREFKKENASNNYYIQVRLSTVFYTLSYVDAVHYQYKVERDSLENAAR